MKSVLWNKRSLGDRKNIQPLRIACEKRAKDKEHKQTPIREVELQNKFYRQFGEVGKTSLPCIKSYEQNFLVKKKNFLRFCNRKNLPSAPPHEN
jgi:hypothetical protein